MKVKLISGLTYNVNTDHLGCLSNYEIIRIFRDAENPVVRELCSRLEIAVGAMGSGMQLISYEMQRSLKRVKR